MMIEIKALYACRMRLAKKQFAVPPKQRRKGPATIFTNQLARNIARTRIPCAPIAHLRSHAARNAFTSALASDSGGSGARHTRMWNGRRAPSMLSTFAIMTEQRERTANKNKAGTNNLCESNATGAGRAQISTIWKRNMDARVRRAPAFSTLLTSRILTAILSSSSGITSETSECARGSAAAFVALPVDMARPRGDDGEICDELAAVFIIMDDHDTNE